MTEWCRHLAPMGWDIKVLCRHYGYTASQSNLSSEVSSGVDVQYLGPRRKQAISDEAARQSVLKSFIRKFSLSFAGKICVPDVLIWKQHQIASRALEIANAFSPDVILSSSPHHSIHWLGRFLSSRLGKPWVADFRDPYTIDKRFCPQSRFSVTRPLHRSFENRIYKNAALITHAIPIHGRWARYRWAGQRSKIKIVTNGIPDFLLANKSTRQNANTIMICSPSRLSPLMVSYLAMIAEARRGECRLEYQIFDNEPTDICSLQAISGNAFVFRGRCSHKETLRTIADADVLIGFLSDERRLGLGLSSKLFEFVASGKPIINVNSTRSDRLFLKSVPWAIELSDPDFASFSCAIGKCIEERPRPSETWLVGFQSEYSRSNQVKKIDFFLRNLFPRHNGGDQEKTRALDAI
ncbi:hypothetical protein CA13_53380 [Planctomycetes bacterium CA13]|uniref:Glycosyltransferase subfamily 4-like N-terminal domain-containing protein n=2 Tax=Novipirellula herctigrandis TaxID=2527986 RepID=A0A5C5Z9I1_9BACT|nr:hypothetical protein CA13_53380 [Planctomycetes bacterium CA13]